MALRLQDSGGDGTIPIREMADGQVATIVQWAEWDRYIGEVVIRRPYAIGGVTFNNSYSAIPKGGDVRVRVLPNGTKLIVHNNE